MTRDYDWEHDPTSEYRRGARGSYARVIVELTGCNPDEAGGIEQLMRDKFSTLDHLRRDDFAREAKAARVSLWRDFWRKPLPKSKRTRR